MRFVLTESMLRELRALRAASPHVDEVMRTEDAFLLDPGLGPSAYLTADGRVLQDFRGWDDSQPPVREATDDEAVTAIVVGAWKTGVTELLELLPRPPRGALPCAWCRGTRWLALPVGRFVCSRCNGRGYER